MPVPFPRGIFAPMCTPFIDGELDLSRARRHASDLVRHGSHGILVAGSGGEFIAMTLEERKRLAEAVVDELAGSAPVNVCVATYGTAEAVELARHAEAIGADAVMVIAPFFMRPHWDAVRRHFTAIREATDLPFMLYNTPSTSGVDISLEDAARLVDEGIFQAFKQSFPDSHHVRDAKALLGERAAVFCGHDGSAFESLVMGADGWTSVLPTVCTARARRLWDGVQANEPLAALAEQWRAVLPLVRLVFFEAGQAAGQPHWLEIYKTAANMAGHDVGTPRPPFVLLRGEQEAHLRDILSRLDVLTRAVAD
jgi:dihydrodipicolinate synthase/N-acetylneuraminate lyase